MPKLLERLRHDPEWNERLDVLERGLESTATPPEGPEQELIEQLADQYNREVTRRMNLEREYQLDRFEDADEETLWAEYLDWYLARRASELMLSEYRLHQVLYGVRWCNGVDHGDGAWTHDDCGGHTDRVFTSKEEVRALPEELVALLMDAADDIEMTAREAKNSRRQGSSFDSSPLPSEVEESTASTPAETRVAPLGTSSSPSATP
jgi:hypothetical protein